MNGICIVAHPDDCIIFGYSYIYNRPDINWTIGYLTYQAHEPRALELIKFWSKRNIPVRLLNFEDHWHDNEQNQFTKWNPTDAEYKIQQLIKDYDLVLTHDSEGDYGHIHHRLVHRACCGHPHLITFAKPGTGNRIYEVPADAYSLDELPQHRDIIKQFHLQQHKNSYKE